MSSNSPRLEVVGENYVHSGRDNIANPSETEDFFDPEVVTSLRRTMLIRGSVRYQGARSPYTLERPNRHVSDLCFLLVPGYFGDRTLYRKQRKATSEAGFDAVTFMPPRSQELAHALSKRHILHPELLLADAVEALMLKLHEKHGINKFVLPGHSMGGPAAIRAATRQPELVEKVILAGSAGLSGHNLGKLALRLPGIARNEVWRHQGTLRTDTKGILWREIKYMTPSLLRTLSEGIAVAQDNILSDIPILQAAGVQVATQQFASDEFFPEAEVRARAESIVDTYHVHPDSSAVHLWPQVEPVSTAHDQLDLVA